MSKEREFVVERIVGKKIEFEDIKYLVKWAGYGDQDGTWEPYTNLTQCLAMIVEFETRFRFPFSSVNASTQTIQYERPQSLDSERLRSVSSAYPQSLETPPSMKKDVAGHP